jgi:hypothetical protein
MSVYGARTEATVPAGSPELQGEQQKCPGYIEIQALKNCIELSLVAMAWPGNLGKLLDFWFQYPCQNFIFYFFYLKFEIM